MICREMINTGKNFINLINKNLKIMLKKGQIVKNKVYGFKGMIEKVFENWQDLKQKNDFLTIEPKTEETSYIERLINDPKDEWLKLQETPFTKEHLQENWYSIRCLDGGAIWCCESRLELIDSLLN